MFFINSTMHVFCLGLIFSVVLFPTGTTAHELSPVEILGHYDNSVGSSDSASQGVIGSSLIQDRALLRPAEVLEYIPGMVVTQHSGDGKANQYFLRGINLDHGTDFATTLNGVPINMPTHAHGHGYSDLNILIPELVSRIDYKKGPYFASEGDFSSAGSANIVYRNKLEKPFSSVTVGEFGYVRALAAGSKDVGEGITLLTAIDLLNNNGPWKVPEGINKTNALFILSEGSPAKGWNINLSAYSAKWNSTDQIPQRLIDTGSYQGHAFGRYDSLDPTDGATTNRSSLSGSWYTSAGDVLTKIDLYTIKYDLKLYSNFTYSLERDNDQFSQTDSRSVWGGRAYRSWSTNWGTEIYSQNTLGIQARQDRIRVGLFDTVSRQIQSTVRDDDVTQNLVGLYGENQIEWSPWFRTILGVRQDQYSTNVTSHKHPVNSGDANASKFSPKLSIVMGPWAKTEIFFNSGRGFHSNDARGTTAKLDPKGLTPIDPVPALVSSRGHEIGLKSEFIKDLQTTLAFWKLDFDSELVYVGDAGNTEPGRPSHRTGIEWSNHWTPSSNFLMDINLAWTKPRYADYDPAGSYIPNAVEKVANVTFALKNMGTWGASVGLRYIGSASLIEDNSVRSSSSVTANFKVNKKMCKDIDLSMDVLNFTNRKNNDISYYYASKLVSESVGVNDIHVHPAEPRTFRATIFLRF